MILGGFIRITVIGVCIFDWVNSLRKQSFSKKAEGGLKTENTIELALLRLHKRLSGRISPNYVKSWYVLDLSSLYNASRCETVAKNQLI